MDSKSLPLIIGVVILLAGAVFLLGRTLTRGPEDSTLPPVTISSPDQPFPGYEEHPSLKAGIEAIRESRFEDAKTALEAVPQSDPGYLIALLNLAILCEQTDEPDRSIEYLTQLRSLQEEKAEVFAALCRAHSLKGDNDEAERFCLRALELQPQNIPVRYHLAFVRTARGEIGDAVNAYRRAMALDPQGDYIDQAVFDLRRLHRAKPELPETHYALAFLANARGENSEELEELNHFLELSPEGPAVALAEARREEAMAEAGAAAQ